ncbi:MAG: hypothetical protein UR81_C0010G0006 [Candidatus Levybacteria bacterium GW2011_GWB1_35_5]|nr:MAG: hypothetical protein UR81_C0010G0006 [Candidatus Levybacteria bacterium GW2011_GWB1_35_5]
MAILNRRKNKSVSHKLKRNIASASWRRNISAREKIIAKELRDNKLG